MTPLALRTLCASLAAAMLLGVAAPARAHRPPDASTASAALSLLPVAVVVSAPAMLLSGAATLTVVAVQASATGTVWVLERASDGARLSVEVAGGAVLSVGTGVAVIALGTGWLLSAAGQAIAFIPNEIGASLLHHERVTR